MSDQSPEAKGKKVEVRLMLPVSLTVNFDDIEGMRSFTVDESDLARQIAGEVVEAATDSMVVEYSGRGKRCRYEVSARAIAYVLVAEQSEQAKKASERTKAMHASGFYKQLEENKPDWGKIDV